MMLGALVDPIVGGKILDAGAGSGVLGLMLAQRCITSLVDGVELDPLAYEECCENLAKSPYRDRMKAYRVDFLEFEPEIPYTLIVSNPPYYLETNSSSERNQREKHLSQGELKAWVMQCKKLLTREGTCWIIFPISMKASVEDIFQDAGFFVHKIYHLENQHGISVRTVFSLTQQALKCETRYIRLRNPEGKYSEEYLELTQDFHGTPLLK